jgi:hypothetical protein
MHMQLVAKRNAALSAKVDRQNSEGKSPTVSQTSLTVPQKIG